ncbi:MAG: DinB family protein [candidate division NC10 bacterium]|nr:DinB family protein [candidate division NC10 bacterium]
MTDPARIQRDMKGTASYLGQVRRQGALRVQAATPALLKRAIAGLGRAALTRRPALGKWSLQEIVCHLADVEVVTGWRYRMILAQSGSPLTAFDQDRWASETNYRRQDPKVALETFAALRRRHLALIRQTPRTAWSRFGIHQERGRVTFRDLVEWEAAHDLNHLAQVTRLRRLLASSRRTRKR